MKGLCILGSTGSVGQNCLKVVRSLPSRFRVVALSAGRNLEALAGQVRDFCPEVVVVGDPELVEPLRGRLKELEYRKSLTILAGTDGQVEAVRRPEVDFVVSAGHGVTGLVATYQAVLAGKRIGLASKEVMVAAGDLVTRAARDRKVDIIPIDSEHSAIHQCMRSGRVAEVRRLILTASGGPFLNTPEEQFDSLTPEQALQHPIWKMGGRITVDSATLMNKGLEVIEAYWLFGLPAEKIDVLIHPESIVHSMIEFVDGSVMAQLSVADMRIPIQYALTYPDRLEADGKGLGLDLLAKRRWSFQEPDRRRFPSLELARQALKAGGSLSCSLNAADEVAVEMFLDGRLRFPDIPRLIEKVMSKTPPVELNVLEQVLQCDQESRQRAREIARDLAGRS